MQLPPGLLHVIAETRLFTDGRPYIIVSLPSTQLAKASELLLHTREPFSALLFDKDEVTLVISREAWELAHWSVDVSAVSPDYRLITFDLPLDLGLVGYIATLTSTVAEQGISVFPLSAFSRDHILVPADDFDRAWEALLHLIQTCRQQESVPLD